MYIYIYIYIYIHTYTQAHITNTASAKTTPVLREARLFLFEPRRFVASSNSKHVPCRVCGFLLKPW